MNRKLSDEQLDRIAKNLLQDFSLDDETLDDIADSPRLWWNVRNRIEAEKTRREKSWFFGFGWQIAAFGALAILFFGGLGVLFLNSNSGETVAGVNEVEIPKLENAQSNNAENGKTEPNVKIDKSEKSEKSERPKSETAKRFSKKEFTKNINSAKSAVNLSKTKPPKIQNPVESAGAETKTDFIALSYSSAADSGQIVRVKVPSSMMVSLGVTAQVESNAKFVNAEVVIGDDGMARAIRFIR